MIARVIPAVLSRHADEALFRLALLERAGVSDVQLDVMDGLFVPQKSWADPKEFCLHDFSLDLTLHLMVRHPERVLRLWEKTEAIKTAIWHIEAPIDHRALLRHCRTAHIRAGLALSPQTPVSAILPYASVLDEVLVLGVRPGKSGQKLLTSTMEKIKALKKIAPRLTIGLDGGITSHNILPLKQAGVRKFYVTHAIFGTSRPIRALNALQKKVNP